jgi:sulfatase maturation enzyme AslB (radical SAM superfamily)
MTFETAQKMVDWLFDENNNYININNSPGIIIEFIGGEPFMAIDLIDQICDYFMTIAIQ